MLGDFVKGDDYNGYSPDIRGAILLHRQIDIFTDAHPTHRRSKTRLDSRHRHTKGVLVDIFYDHFLARNWSEYTDSTLKEFTTLVYRALQAHMPILPPRLKRILPGMRSVVSRGASPAGMSWRRVSRNYSRTMMIWKVTSGNSSPS
jgi:acyl carrier protein phosphodiesterase